MGNLVCQLSTVTVSPYRQSWKRNLIQSRETLSKIATPKTFNKTDLEIITLRNTPRDTSADRISSLRFEYRGVIKTSLTRLPFLDRRDRWQWRRERRWRATALRRFLHLSIQLLSQFGALPIDFTVLRRGRPGGGWRFRELGPF